MLRQHVQHMRCIKVTEFHVISDVIPFTHIRENHLKNLKFVHTICYDPNAVLQCRYYNISDNPGQVIMLKKLHLKRRRIILFHTSIYELTGIECTHFPRTFLFQYVQVNCIYLSTTSSIHLSVLS